MVSFIVHSKWSLFFVHPMYFYCIFSRPIFSLFLCVFSVWFSCALILCAFTLYMDCFEHCVRGLILRTLLGLGLALHLLPFLDKSSCTNVMWGMVCKKKPIA